VLHGGSSQPAPYTDVSGPFRLNLIVYTGNGGYQTRTGMGFGSQVLIILPSTSSLASGAYKLARLGGTFAMGFESGGTRSMNGVLAITDDGFSLGPNNNVNQNTVQYLAIGMQDGGAAGFFLDHLTRMGGFVDNWDIPFGDGFTPDIAWHQAVQTGATIIRTPQMVGDLSVSWSGLITTSNLIQALNADGFEVGNNTTVNGSNIQMLEFILRIGSLTNLIHTGTLTPGGSSATITGIPFTPTFVMCQKQANSGSGAWRSSLMTNHVGTTSTQWVNGGTTTTGITSITADGFTIGSLLAQNGVPVHCSGSVPWATASMYAGVCTSRRSSHAAAGASCKSPGCTIPSARMRVASVSIGRNSRS